VEHAIAILKGEIQRTMAQVGVRRVEDVDPARVVARGIQPRNPSAEELERGHARGPDNQ
jgi:isopentenyl diphosphate isomerase/L-lactate dehydrogenase-like FMN-dependent dehydrogenase